MSTLHPAIAQALVNFAPPQSVVHEITEDERLTVDLQLLADIKSGADQWRRDNAALEIQKRMQAVFGDTP